MLPPGGYRAALLAAFVAGGLAAQASAALKCDHGTLDTICNITSSQNLPCTQQPGGWYGAAVVGTGTVNIFTDPNAKAGTETTIACPPPDQHLGTANL